MIGHRYCIPRSHWLLALFFFSVLLRLSYFWTVQDGPLVNLDSAAYEELAQKLLTRPSGVGKSAHPRPITEVLRRA